MKPSYLIPLFAVFMASVLFSCSKANEDEPNLNLNQQHMGLIKGSYEWVKSETHHTSQGVSTASNIYPDSMNHYGITVKLSGAILYSKNGTTIQTGAITATTQYDSKIWVSSNLNSSYTMSVAGTALFSDHFPFGLGDNAFNYFTKVQ